MKTKTHTTPRMVGSAFVFALMWAATLTGTVSAQGTAFTYQGHLKESGTPANGAYDMTFRIFDADVDGSQHGSDYALNGVSVADGLFTVDIDFGPGVFTGVPLWLEIEVNAELLSPRQAITATPYAQSAIFAQTASYADTAGSTGPWQTNGADVWYDGGGVGVIGGSSPFPSGKGVFIEGGSAASALIFAYDYDVFQPLSLILNSPGGNVGIGTGAPTSKLHVAASSGNTIYGSTSGGTALAGVATSNFGGTGVYGEHQNGFNYGSLGTLSAGVTGVAQIAGNFGGSFANIDSGGVALQVTQGATRVKKLEAEAIGQGAEILRLTTERPWAFKQAYSGSGTALRLQPDTGLKNFEIAAAGGTIVATFEGNDAAPRLVVNGTTSTKVLQITGADLAEKFPSSDCAEPGMVMEIDPENPGLIRMARGAYNQRVAGVVSGANDFPAGAILGHLPGNEDAPPIALSGRVWTHCDASEAAIAPGDLLTTSATPGHAMKAVDRNRSHGAVIGKAMTSLQTGRGMVLVLVNLQ